MPGSKEGSKKAVATIYERHGRDFFARIGAMGGHISRHGGFASTNIGKDGLTGRERSRLAGKKGGTKSRKKSSPVRQVETGAYFRNASEAAKVVHVCPSTLYKSLNTGTKAGGYHWERVA